MKVKDAIKQLETMYQEAELVIGLDEFPSYYNIVLGFREAKAAPANRGYFDEGHVLQHCEKRTDLKNVRSVVVCENEAI